jgi:serine/threonine protein kinase
MRCPRCYTENVDTSRFCVSCATPLPGGGGGADPPSPGGFRSPGSPYVFPPHTSATGRLVGGKYEIAEEIGRGGMGVVYRARDVRLERWVALKFLPSSLADSAELRERFLVEARAAAALAHPNICVIHEVGEDEGQPFLAMEYVEGETLQRKIRAGVLGNEEILSIMTQVASGLEEAHGKGIIHRDIKSSNIMITAKGQAKIMDFGLAKVRGGPALTKTHSTLGTVAYMSPEQAQGEEVDHRTDLWSAGVVLYEMQELRPLGGRALAQMVEVGLEPLRLQVAEGSHHELDGHDPLHALGLGVPEDDGQDAPGDGELMHGARVPYPPGPASPASACGTTGRGTGAGLPGLSSRFMRRSTAWNRGSSR